MGCALGNPVSGGRGGHWVLVIPRSGDGQAVHLRAPRVLSGGE